MKALVLIAALALAGCSTYHAVQGDGDVTAAVIEDVALACDITEAVGLAPDEVKWAADYICLVAQSQRSGRVALTGWDAGLIRESCDATESAARHTADWQAVCA